MPKQLIKGTIIVLVLLDWGLPPKDILDREIPCCRRFRREMAILFRTRFVKIALLCRRLLLDSSSGLPAAVAAVMWAHVSSTSISNCARMSLEGERRLYEI